MIPWSEIVRFHALLLGVALVAMGYGLFVKRLAVVVQPLRLRLAERGEKYLAVCKDPRERALVRFCLDHAFSPWVCIATSVTLPIAFITQIFRPTEVIKKIDEDENRRIAALFALSVFSANPFFGAIIVLEVAIAITLMVIIKGQINALFRAATSLFERLANKSTPRHGAAVQH